MPSVSRKSVPEDEDEVVPEDVPVVVSEFVPEDVEENVAVTETSPELPSAVRTTRVSFG